MPIPEHTHLQFLMLTILLDEEQTGRQMREKLAEQGAPKSIANFYQLMARLEDAGLVKSWRDQEIVEGHIIKDRRYKLTAAGVRAWKEVRDFYLAHARRRLQGARP
jgi:DNA-binding PadR family transcriptional regulator